MRQLDLLDVTILETARPDWRKLAFIIGVVCENTKVDEETVAVRIADLVETGRLEAQGDLALRRETRIRLK